MSKLLNIINIFYLDNIYLSSLSTIFFFISNVIRQSVIQTRRLDSSLTLTANFSKLIILDKYSGPTVIHKVFHCKFGHYNYKRSFSRTVLTAFVNVMIAHFKSVLLHALSFYIFFLKYCKIQFQNFFYRRVKICFLFFRGNYTFGSFIYI